MLHRRHCTFTGKKHGLELRHCTVQDLCPNLPATGLGNLEMESLEGICHFHSHELYCVSIRILQALSHVSYSRGEGEHDCLFERER